jgi:hypothetical protein
MSRNAGSRRWSHAGTVVTLYPPKAWGDGIVHQLTVNTYPGWWLREGRPCGVHVEANFYWRPDALPSVTAAAARILQHPPGGHFDYTLSPGPFFDAVLELPEAAAFARAAGPALIALAAHIDQQPVKPKRGKP